MRHWRGELSLPVSYWANGFAVTLAFTALIVLVPWTEFVSAAPKVFSAALVALWLLLAVVTLWQFVGTWRSAGRYLRAGGSKAWGALARGAVVLGCLKAVVEIGTVGVPQMAEYGRIALGLDAHGAYSLRLLRDATEVEVQGAIAFGLTEEVRALLDAHPGIRVIHLNSNGGRLGEARKLRDLIAERGLTTFTAAGCLSACTLAYAAGKLRLIGREASLGFHQYAFPGIGDTQFQRQYEFDKKDWLARGFAQAFVDQAFLTPHDQLWRPSHQELFAWGVVNGYPAANQVALSGFRSGAAGLEASLEAELQKNPLFPALKAYEPELYAKLHTQLLEGVQQGRTAGELRARAFPMAQAAFLRRLPHSSDAAIRGFAGLLVEQMDLLYAADPVLCHDFAFDRLEGTRFNPASHFPKALREREFSVTAEVFRSAAEHALEPPTEEAVRRQQSQVMAELRRQHGDAVALLGKPAGNAADKGPRCLLAHDLYVNVLALPEAESGALLRHMFASAR